MASIIDYLKFIGRKCPTYDQVYPVGSIYMSANSTNPGTLFGGSWTQIQGRFLVGCGSNGQSGNAYLNVANGATGGETNHTLTAGEAALKSHSHGFTQPTVDQGGGASITGGGHYHNFGYQAGYGSGTKQGARSYNSTGKDGDWATSTDTHTHTLPHHTHRVSGGAVSNKDGENAASAHNNLPPYFAVYIWRRTA